MNTTTFDSIQKNIEHYGLNDHFINEAKAFPQYVLARVSAQYKGMYKIVTRDGACNAKISGKRRYETNELAKYPTVGDFVMVSFGNTDKTEAVIHHILPRTSVFLRTAVGVTGQAQPVAANIDIVFICMSLNNNYNLSRLERYLCVAWDSGALPVILLTKSDLCQDLTEVIEQVREASAYSDVIPVNCYEDCLVEKLSAYLKPGVTAAFIGSSGVGKSTLINHLLGTHALETHTIGRGDKGRHTTTGREMFPAPGGAVLIDTPGMRELGAESADLSQTFDDIEMLANGCKFSDCTHTSEPGCAVRAALEDGSLERRRFESYTKLKTEAGYEGLNSREIENKKFERMFKEVGGMKNARKAAKHKKHSYN